MRIGWILWFGVACSACGPSNAEIKTARTATYDASPSQLFAAAVEAARETYKIGEGSAENCVFATARTYYGPEGDLESKGAGDFYHLAPNSVGVSFIVRVVASDDGIVIAVEPDTIQVLEGSPQPRKLGPDDPYLPSFVKGRADSLAIAIHERASKIVPGPKGDWRGRAPRCDQ